MINLLIDLQRKHDLSYLFIAHDLAVVAHISHRVAVMYLGAHRRDRRQDRAVRQPAPSLHPGAAGLRAGRRSQAQSAWRRMIDGDVPSPINPPSGCAFHTRCRYAMERCKVERPELADVGGQHQVACLLNEGTGREA